MVPFKVLIKALTQPNFRSLLNIINTCKRVSIKTATLALILFKKSNCRTSQYYYLFFQLRLPSCGINIL